MHGQTPTTLTPVRYLNRQSASWVKDALINELMAAQQARAEGKPIKEIMYYEEVRESRGMACCRSRMACTPGHVTCLPIYVVIMFLSACLREVPRCSLDRTRLYLK